MIPEFLNKISLSINKFQLTIVEILVDMLMDSCPQDNQGRTPLHYAAMNGHLEVIKLLIPVTKNLIPGFSNNLTFFLHFLSNSKGMGELFLYFH